MSAASRGVDPKTFRELLGSWASGVAVLTSRTTDGAPAGMTASAVSAVSLEPPLILVCVGHESEFHEVLDARTPFVINILAADQQELSDRFAGERTTRFTGVNLAIDDAGDPPVLAGAAAHIHCVVQRQVTAGDHTIFIALVRDGQIFDRAPLVHFRGTYNEVRTTD